MVGSKKISFSIVRYGNVISSRGSVIPLFKDLVNSGKKKLPLTDPRMTRFVISLDEGVDFVLNCITIAAGGEIFVPKIPSIKIVDLIETMVAKGAYEIVGIRAGEKLHEVMIPKEESRNCIEMKDKFIIIPQLFWWDNKMLHKSIISLGKKVPQDFEYTSDKNKIWLSIKELQAIIKGK